MLFTAEAMAPGAFMLWLGFAAAAVFAIVLVVPGVTVLAQVAAFVVLSFVSIQVYRSWFRGREPTSDKPTLNRRAEALVAARGSGEALPLFPLASRALMLPELLRLLDCKPIYARAPDARPKAAA